MNRNTDSTPLEEIVAAAIIGDRAAPTAPACHHFGQDARGRRPEDRVVANDECDGVVPAVSPSAGQAR